MVTTISTRIDDKYVKKIDELATRKGVDRSALLRSFLLFALNEYTIRESLEKYQDGKTTLWEAAEQCNLSLWEMVQEVKQRQIHTPYDIEELEKDLKDL
jgi:predicted transcriptional regulator